MNERIKKIRKALGITQDDFGKKIGLARNSIANYEIARRIPSNAVITSICREFNINEEWLRNGTGKMFNEKSTFSLDEYAKANKLNETEKAIVRGFMELKPEIRNAVYDVFKKAFEAESSVYSNAPDNPQELERMYPPVDDESSNIG